MPVIYLWVLCESLFLVPTITNIVNLSLTSGHFHPILLCALILFLRLWRYINLLLTYYLLTPRICYLPTSQETYSRQRPTFQLWANLQPVSHIQNNRTCCKILTYWPPCLQWSFQSQPVCLLQASLHWNISAVYPWSSHHCHRITEVVMFLSPWSLCRFWHHRPQYPNHPPVILVWNIQGSVLNWFESYLTSRSFRVKCDKDFSSEHISSSVSYTHLTLPTILRV